MDIYEALAEPRRRQIIELIALKGSLTATDISANFQISPPAISQHLKILREAKLVDMEKKAQSRIYTINTKSFDELSDWINKMTQMWEEKFSRLDVLLEKMKQPAVTKVLAGKKEVKKK